MKKSVKTALIVSVTLILSGLVILFAVLWSLSFDLSKLDYTAYNNVEYKVSVYDVDYDFTDVYIDETSLDINFELTSEEKAWYNKDACGETGEFYKQVYSVKTDGLSDERINALISWYKTLATKVENDVKPLNFSLNCSFIILVMSEITFLNLLIVFSKSSLCSLIKSYLALALLFLLQIILQILLQSFCL